MKYFLLLAMTASLLNAETVEQRELGVQLGGLRLSQAVGRRCSLVKELGPPSRRNPGGVGGMEKHVSRGSAEDDATPGFVAESRWDRWGNWMKNRNWDCHEGEG
jgi:hypothetical protein